MSSITAWLLAGIALAAPIECPCDCDRSGSVTVDEILTAVAVALGTRSVADCPAAVRGEDGRVTVDDLVTCIDVALRGCRPAVPTPTATPSEAVADLYFSSVAGDSLGYSCADDARNPKMRACIGNRGTATASSFALALQGAAESIDLWRLSLPAGEEACLHVPLHDSAELRIDPDDQVAESDESNNVAQQILPTLTRGPACTPTPTPGEPYPDCCERSDGCSGRTSPSDCYRSGGSGLPAPFVCDPTSGACAAPDAPPPPPTATPAADPPDLVPDVVWPCSFALGCGAFGRGPFLVACIENLGPGPSPAAELAIGSYWKVLSPPLAPRERECYRAPRIDRGHIVADPAGLVGEADESNNRLTFSTTN